MLGRNQLFCAGALLRAQFDRRQGVAPRCSGQLPGPPGRGRPRQAEGLASLRRGREGARGLPAILERAQQGQSGSQSQEGRCTRSTELLLRGGAGPWRGCWSRARGGLRLGTHHPLRRLRPSAASCCCPRGGGSGLLSLPHPLGEGAEPGGDRPAGQGGRAGAQAGDALPPKPGAQWTLPLPEPFSAQR